MKTVSDYIFPLSKCLCQARKKEIIPVIWIFAYKYLLDSVRFDI